MHDRFLRCSLLAITVAWPCLLHPVWAQDQPKASDKASAELALHQGTWQVESSIREGEEIDPEIAASIQRIVTDDHIVWKRAGKSFSGSTFVLNLESDPHTIDIIPDGGPARDKKNLGIYKFENERLVICMADPDQPRPTRFAAEKGSRQTLMRFKPIKPAQEPSPADDEPKPP